jgi:LDH2 family malate/lactate/ureidoglycolate dehydrogenase
MEKVIAELKSSPLAEGSDEICYPGEIEARNDQRYRGEGLQLAAETVDDLCKLAAETGFDPEVPWSAKPATGAS